MKITANNSPDFLSAFFIGDALDEAFEFATPSPDDIRRRWKSDVQNLNYTDDSILVASSIHALEVSTRNTPKSAQLLDSAALDFLADWWESRYLRGIGVTTEAAIRQITEHRHKHGWLVPFSIDETDYPTDISAGNGILSRVLPFGLGPAIGKTSTGLNLERFLQLTQLHEDGHASAGVLVE